MSQPVQTTLWVCLTRLDDLMTACCNDLECLVDSWLKSQEGSREVVKDD